MWQKFLERTLFSVGTRPYLGVDVVLDAMEHGKWANFARALAEGLACEGRADAEDAWPVERDVTSVANDFRYEHDLLAAADLTAWLAAAGLSLDEWLGFAQRKAMRGAWRTQLPAMVDDYPPSMAQLLDAAPADGLCSGALVQLAESLAGRAAVVAQAASGPMPLVPPALSDPLDAATLEWFPSWSQVDLRARMAYLREVAARFDVIARQATTASAVESRLHEHALEWMRVELEWIACPDQSAARETELCVREDGMTLSVVAVVGGGTLRRGSFLLAELEPARREVILSARPGDLAGTFATEDHWDVLQVVAKRPATLADPEVRARAEAAVVSALTSAAAAMVRWQINR